MTTLLWWLAGTLGLSGLAGLAWLVVQIRQAGQDKEKAKHADVRIKEAEDKTLAALQEATRLANGPVTPGDTAEFLRARAEAKRKSE